MQVQRLSGIQEGSISRTTQERKVILGSKVDVKRDTSEGLVRPEKFVRLVSTQSSALALEPSFRHAQSRQNTVGDKQE